MTAPAPLAKSPLQLAKDAYNARNGNHALKLAAQMMADDYWAGGLGWSGPLPRATNSADLKNVARVTAEIRREFVSRNMLDNLVTRHVYGIAGREPLLSVGLRRRLKDKEQPSREERGRIAEYTDAFTDWWDNSGAWLSVQQALKTAVWSGKGTLRLFIPQSKLQDITDAAGRPARGIPAGLDLAEALAYVSVHAPEWNQAGVVRDGDRRVLGAYYRYSDETKQDRWEVQERVGRQTRVTPTATGADTDPCTDYPVSDLLIFEVALNPLIKSSIVTLAKFLNKTLTMGSRNINLGGFVERTILNAQMPGRIVKGEDGKEKFLPDAYEVGMGSTGYINGLPIRALDEGSGKWKDTGNYTTPSIQYKDPVPWEATFGKSTENIREMLFDEAKQLHVLITGDATANGVSRQQAVNDFVTSLEPTRMALEQLLRWLMTTVLKLGLHFTGRLAEWDAFKAAAQARMSAVQPTSAEVETARNLRKDGLISLKDFYARIGVEDADAMRANIAAEGVTPDVALVMLASALPAFVGMRAAQQAWPALGITDEDIQLQRDIDLSTGGAGLDLGTDPQGDPTDPPDAGA